MLAFRALPLVLVVSALSALLYHWRVLPVIVKAFAWVLTRVMRIGGAASFATAANIFVGMVESPLLVKPYLERMSRADLFIVMTAGLSTIAGTVFVLYSTLLQDVLPNAAGHLLTASVLSAPAAVVVARLMVPAGASDTQERIEFERRYDDAMDAVAAGTIDGLRLLAYIIGFVLVLVALVELANILFGGLGIMLGGLGALVPSRRKDVLELGIKSLIAGNIATFMTGAVAALVS